MNILISNDDGIYAKGIKVLVRYLKADGHNTYVVAPLKEESGTGHGVTLHRPLRVAKAYRGKEFFGYSVDGKPSDCVKLGYWGIYKDIKFDFVISGINKGENLGSDMLYSGTFSAAAEGALIGKKAIAISLKKTKEKYRFKTAAKFLVEYLKEIKGLEFPHDGLLNINIPNIKYSELKGYKYTKQGDRKYKDNFIEREDPQKNKYYWLGGEAVEYETDKEADFNAVKASYVSISPVKLDLTDYDFMKKLKARRNK